MSIDSAAGAAGAPSARDGSALLRCVDCTAAEFADRHWGRHPRLSRPDGAGFADLLDADAVDELVSRRGLRTPFLRMAKDGTVLPSGRFTRGGGAGATIADQAADDRVLAALADDATLVLQALHRTWPPLVEFGARLAGELGHPVQVNAYVTPPQSTGFSAHYDVHDVFVLQVSGRKAWTIHEPVVTDPLDNQPWDARGDEVAARAAEVPILETVLTPGDALYLPRGTIHAASALGETSIHLTIGVHPVTRYQLVKHLVDAAQDDPALRASLPAGVDLADPAVVAPLLADTLAALQERLDRAQASDVAQRIGGSLMQRTRPLPIGPLATLAAADALDVGSRVTLRPGLRLRVDEDAEHVHVVLADRRVSLPAVAGDAIKTAVSGAVFSVGDLPGLPGEDQLVAVRRLLREGILVPA